MNREILFRAKTKDSNEWVEGYFIQGLNPEFCYIVRDFDYKIRQIYEIKTKTLSQYTGLKDKNGKKVFENDIVKYTRKNIYEPGASFHNQDIINSCTIFWCNKDKMFKNKGKYESGGGWEGSIKFYDERAGENIIEIIGNKFE